MDAPSGGQRDGRSAADIALGTATLSHGEAALGPFAAAVGLGDRAMIGTYLLPWSISLLAPGSVVPNAFGKLEVVRHGRWSVGASTTVMHARLDDLDGDGLDARALVWPSTLTAAARWNERWASTLELTGVLVRATADTRRRQDTAIYGLALANALHVAWIQRWRWTPQLTVWARARLVLDHAPVQVEARAALSDDARVRVRARANSAELSSAGSGTVGVVWTWRRMNLRAGLGYGHWILPWVQLPVGRRIPSGELDVYWRF